ncbi:MAG: hypothetical protein JW791_04985 [Nanoarchaeota archaeon]|nr:hypothetical protein [Nanoarchaeota archaeon]
MGLSFFDRVRFRGVSAPMMKRMEEEFYENKEFVDRYELRGSYQGNELEESFMNVNKQAQIIGEINHLPVCGELVFNSNRVLMNLALILDINCEKYDLVFLKNVFPHPNIVGNYKASIREDVKEISLGSGKGSRVYNMKVLNEETSDLEFELVPFNE